MQKSCSFKALTTSLAFSILSVLGTGCTLFGSNLPEATFKSDTLPGRWFGQSECTVQLGSLSAPLPISKQSIYDIDADGSLVFNFGDEKFSLTEEGMRIQPKRYSAEEYGVKIDRTVSGWVVTRSVTATESKFEIQFLIEETITTAEQTNVIKTNQQISLEFKIVDGQAQYQFSSEKISDSQSTTPAGEVAGTNDTEVTQCKANLSFWGK
jgi:hypothetical protein